MTLGELITKVEELSPSEYDKTELTQWVSELEFMAVDQVFSKAFGVSVEYKPYNYELDAEKELLIPDQFNGVYTSYISTKIDYNNREIDRYNVDAVQFESEWQAFASWYRRQYKPRRKRHAFPADHYSPI